MTTATPILPSTIENAMIARIAAAQGAGGLGYTLKTLKTYGGELADDLSRIAVNFPAMWAVWKGLKVIKKFSPALYQVSAQFGIIVASGNLRSEAAARAGDAHTPGSYKLAMDAFLLLSGQTLGLDMRALQPLSITPLINDKRGQQLASIYAVDFDTVFCIDAGALAAGMDDFKIFHANWDIPPHGNVDRAIPDDADADATDNVLLVIVPEGALGDPDGSIIGDPDGSIIGDPDSNT